MTKYRLLFLQFIVSATLFSQSLVELQRSFVELRFGMFVHFGIMTFTGKPWATPHQDVRAFNPQHLDCAQWLQAAAKAKMKFAILTTKHHDGFCLWNSAYTRNSVASSPWKNGTGDVVREFVTACRRYNIEPCLYYSIWDVTEGIGNEPITQQQIDFVKGQLTELLSNYGTIRLLFLDGWSWKMGHRKIPYDEIRELVKKLQPNCLLVDNTHLLCLYHNDLIHYEAGKELPKGNTLPALFSRLINVHSGNDWFWEPRVAADPLLSAENVVSTLTSLEGQWCNFVLNCPPNADGLLDSNIVRRLQEIGQQWNPDTLRPPLPLQSLQIEFSITPDTAVATSGNAFNAIDGINDRYFYSVWQSSAVLPQSLTIDLGSEYDSIAYVGYVPPYKPYIQPLREGCILAYSIAVSTDGENFLSVAEGRWQADSAMKVVEFSPSRARYIRITAFEAVGGYAAATEFVVGRKGNTMKK